MLTLRLETYGHQGLALASELIRSLPNLKTLVVKFDILAAQNLPQDQFISRSIDFELIARSISRHQLCSLRLASSSHLFDCSTSVLHAAGKGLKQIDLGNAQVSNQFLEALIDGGRESIESLWLPFSVISPYASRPSLCRIKCSKLKRIGFSTRQGIDMRPFLEANPWINELICGGRIGEVVSACPSAESVVFTNKIPELECIDALRNLPSFSTLRRLRFGTLDGPTLGFESCLRSLPSLEYLSCSGHQLGVDDCNNSGEYYDALFSGGSSIALTQVRAKLTQSWLELIGICCEIYTCSFPSLQFVEMIECPFRFIGLPLPPLIEYYGGLRGESNLLRWKFEDVYDLRLLTPSMINSVQMARARQWVEVISSLIDVQTREFVTRAPKLQRARFRPYAYPYDSDLDVIIKRHTNGDYFVLGGFGRDDAGGLSEGDKRFFTQLQYDGPWTTSWK